MLPRGGQVNIHAIERRRRASWSMAFAVEPRDVIVQPVKEDQCVERTMARASLHWALCRRTLADGDYRQASRPVAGHRFDFAAPRRMPIMHVHHAAEIDGAKESAPPLDGAPRSALHLPRPAIFRACRTEIFHFFVTATDGANICCVVGSQLFRLLYILFFFVN